MRYRLLLALVLTGVTGLAVYAAAQPDAPPKPEAAKPADNGSEPAPLTKAQEEELLTFLKKTGSEQYERLIQLRNVNPTTYQSNARSWYYWMQGLKRYPEALQKVYVVQQETYTRIYRLVADLRVATDDTQRKALQDQLKTQVTQLFDAQNASREYRVAQLEAELQLLKSGIAETKKNREQKIDENLRKWEALTTQPVSPTGGPLPPPPTTQPAN